MEARTEIEFFDSECTVMSNLPVPKQNEVYYWEAKIYDKPESTLLSIGMSTKPYPLFRLPGMLIRSKSTRHTPRLTFVQDTTSTPLPIHPTVLDDIISPLTQPLMDPSTFRAMLSASAIVLGQGPFSLPATGSAWRMLFTA